MNFSSPKPNEMVIKLICLTGPPGVGKTTIVKRLAADFNKLDSLSNRSVSGFYTEEVRNADGNRIGFDAVLLNDIGDRCVLARLPSAGSAHRGAPMVGRYRVYVGEFEDLVCDALTTARCGCVIIDEIGKMELLSAKFAKHIAELLSHQTVDLVIATIPLRGGGKLVDRLRQTTAELFTVTKANRNTIYDDIVKQVENHQRKQ